MDNYNNKNKLRVFTAFSGYDSQCMALDRLKEPAKAGSIIQWSRCTRNIQTGCIAITSA